jgi:hypothetical protein
MLPPGTRFSKAQLSRYISANVIGGGQDAAGLSPLTGTSSIDRSRTGDFDRARRPGYVFVVIFLVLLILGLTIFRV